MCGINECGMSQITTFDRVQVQVQVKVLKLVLVMLLPRFLRKDYPIQRHVLLVPQTALRLLGFDPESPVTATLALWAFFNWAVLVYGDYAEFYYGVHYLTVDPVRSLDAICPVLSSIMSLVKLTVIWWHRDALARLFRLIRERTAGQSGDAKLAMKRDDFTLATRLSALVCFFGMCTSTSYTIRPIIKNVLNYMDGKPFAYDTPFNMLFPAMMLRMPWYPLTFLFSHWHGYVTVFGFVGADCLLLGMGFYFAALLKALQLDVHVLLYDRDARTPRAGVALSETQVYTGIVEIVERHNDIAELLADFSSLMAGIVLSHFILAIITLGTCIIDLMLLPGYGAIFYVVHACAVVTQVFLYSLGGSAVMVASEALATEAYCSYWYTHSVRIQKMVLLLMLRAQRTLVVKVPFFAPSMETFTWIIRTSGSLIALINSVI